MRQQIIGSVMISLMVAGCGGGAPTAPMSNYAQNGAYMQSANPAYNPVSQPAAYGGMTQAPSGVTGTYSSMSETPIATGEDYDYGMAPEPVMAEPPLPQETAPQAPLASAPQQPLAPALPVVHESPDPTPVKESFWSKVKNTAKGIVKKVKDKLSGDD